MTWEGFEALDDCGSDVETTVPKAAAQKTKKQKLSVSTKVVPPARLLNPPQSSEESDNESEDDYVAEGGTNQAAKSKGKVISLTPLPLSLCAKCCHNVAPSSSPFFLQFRLQCLIR